jgi:hypothetical protein
MKKLLLILLVLYGCNTEEITPIHDVKGRYIAIDQNHPNSSMPCIITDKVLFNNVWEGDYEIKDDSIFFICAYNNIRWHFRLKIQSDKLEGNHYRLNIDLVEQEKFQPGNIIFIKQ